MKKKFIPIYLLISIALFFVGVIVSSNVPAFQSLFSGTTLYTPAMVETVKQDSYNQGVVDKETLLKELASCKSSLEQIIKERDNLKLEVEELEQENTAKDEAYNELENSKNEEINNLEKEKADLQNQIQAKDLEISNLNSTITDLQYRVSYLEKLLEAYENVEKLPVTFEVDGEVYDVQLINPGEYATSPVPPTKEGATFVSWAVNDRYINVSSYQITKDITFVAVFEYRLLESFELLGTFTPEQMTAGFTIDFDKYVNFNKSLLDCKRSTIQVEIRVQDETTGTYTSFVSNNFSTDEISFEGAGLSLTCEVGEDNTLHFNKDQSYTGTYEFYEVYLTLILVND